MSKYTEMKECLQARISQLEKAKEDYRDRYMDSWIELATLREKCKIYEKLLNKFVGDANSTDDLFMFEGKLYRPVSFSLNREPDHHDILNVEFVHVPVPENV